MGILHTRTHIYAHTFIPLPPPASTWQKARPYSQGSDSTGHCQGHPQRRWHRTPDADQEAKEDQNESIRPPQWHPHDHCYQTEGGEEEGDSSKPQETFPIDTTSSADVHTLLCCCQMTFDVLLTLWSLGQVHVDIWRYPHGISDLVLTWANIIHIIWPDMRYTYIHCVYLIATSIHTIQITCISTSINGLAIL